jgi:hypothetical protein
MSDMTPPALAWMHARARSVRRLRRSASARERQAVTSRGLDHVWTETAQASLLQAMPAFERAPRLPRRWTALAAGYQLGFARETPLPDEAAPDQAGRLQPTAQTAYLRFIGVKLPAGTTRA